MRFRGTHSGARVSGLAGLAGANAFMVYAPYANKVAEVFAKPYPGATGSRPPDSLIFSDKYAYLRQVLNNADWSGVARWYATQIQQAVNASGWYDPLNPPVAPPPASTPPPAPTSYIPETVATVSTPPPIINRPILTDRILAGGKRAQLRGLAGLEGLNPKEYWNLSKLNLQDYCDRTFTMGDLHAFTKECILKMCVADYGNKVGFGYQGGMDNLSLAMFFANGLSHNDGQLDWFKSYDATKGGYRYGMCIGWVKEPSKHTASMIMVAIGAAFMGAAAWQAISATGSTVASAGATGGGITGGGGAGAAAGGITSAGIETVVVAAPALAPITAGTIGAGLATGAIAATAAAPAITSPAIETVTVTAAPVSTVTAGSVAAGVASGTVAAVASAPPLVTPASPIETVTVEASANQPVTAGTVGAGLATGTIAATATAPSITTGTIETVTVEAPAETIQIDPVEAAITGVTSIAITQPTISVPEPNLPEIDTEQTLTDRIVEGLENAIADIGADAVMSELEKWLEDLLGRPPTSTEVDQWGDWIDSGGTTSPPTVSEPLLKNPAFWILAGVIGYTVYELSKDKKRPKH